ncbi:MAG: hypothetical protein MZV65_53240 [Chromatiales bacterium]|nr:hypothetical protein [Chromatiales bacterium]
MASTPRRSGRASTSLGPGRRGRSRRSSCAASSSPNARCGSTGWRSCRRVMFFGHGVAMKITGRTARSGAA